MSIPGNNKKINTLSSKKQGFLQDILMALVIILVATGSFGLGRLSAEKGEKRDRDE